MYNRYFNLEINTETQTMLERGERFKVWLKDKGER